MQAPGATLSAREMGAALRPVTSGAAQRALFAWAHPPAQGLKAAQLLRPRHASLPPRSVFPDSPPGLS